MDRIDRIILNPIGFPDTILYILSIDVNRIPDGPLIISNSLRSPKSTRCGVGST